MTKKITSLVLALAMCLTLYVPAVAIEQDSVATADRVKESQIQQAIQLEEEQVWSDLYKQLKAQNALVLMDSFKEVLRPKIEAKVRTQYNMAANGMLASTSSKTYYFPNGGYVAYTSTTNANIVETCLNPDDYKNYIIDNSNTLGDIFLGLLGFLPSGQIFSVVALLNVVASRTAQKAVKANGYYAEVITIEGGVGESASYVTAWKKLYNVDQVIDYGSFKRRLTIVKDKIN